MKEKIKNIHFRGGGKLMPREMMIALSLIFALFLLMIARTDWLLRKEKGGKPMKQSNGRYKW